jgi:hypothetical protein
LDFTVNFIFEKNNFFDEEILFKSFVYDENTFEPIRANASVVIWKEGKNPSLKIKTKKIKSKKNLLKIFSFKFLSLNFNIFLFNIEGKSVEVKTTETTVPSFFDIFVAEESGEDKLPEIIQQSEFIRDELLTNSLELYLNILEDNNCDENEEEECCDEEPKEKSKNKKISVKNFIL